MNESDNRSTVQWLRILFYIELASVALSVLCFLPFIQSGWFDWFRRIFTAGMIYCMFKLAATQSRYGKAAIFRAVQLVCSLLTAALTAWMFQQFRLNGGLAQTTTQYNTVSMVIGTVSMVASWIATYQFYNAHGDLVAEQDTALARKWRRLFFWALGISVCRSAVSMLLTYLRVEQVLDIGTYGLLSTVLISVPPVILGLFSVVYLYRTIQTLS